MARLKGRRKEQLRLLYEARAFTRATAVAVMSDRAYSPATLSAMIGEGLVEQAELPFKGDSRRRVSHYWLTGNGCLAIDGAGAVN